MWIISQLNKTFLTGEALQIFATVKGIYWKYNFLLHSLLYGDENVTDCYSKSNFCGRRPPQFIVAGDNNLWEVTESLFAAKGRYSSLSPNATTFEKLQDRDNMVTLAYWIVTLYDWMPGKWFVSLTVGWIKGFQSFAGHLDQLDICCNHRPFMICCDQ